MASSLLPRIFPRIPNHALIQVRDQAMQCAAMWRTGTGYNEERQPMFRYVAVVIITEGALIAALRFLTGWR
jgi:hypothetical protein